jgi:hypothetical protein
MSQVLDDVAFKKDSAEWRNFEIIFYHGLALTLNLDMSQSNKDLVFLTIGAMTINFWVWRTLRRETPMTFNHELGKNLPSLQSLSES